MPFTAPAGPSGTSTGPSPLATVFSDRAGEEGAASVAGTAQLDPLAQVLRTLDSISTPQGELDRALGGEASDAGRCEGIEGAADGTTPAGSARSEAILDAASALFAERGYHGASLRDISRRVGISHPGMLHHFSSKEVLLGAVIDRLEAHAQGLLDSVDALTDSPQSLRAALTGPWDPREHSMALLSTLSAEVVNPDHPGRFRIARLRLVHEHILERVFTGLGENGHLVDGVQPRIVARLLFSLLLSLTVREHTVAELQTAPTADPIADVQNFLDHVIRT